MILVYLLDVAAWFKILLQKYCDLSNPHFIKLCFLLTPKKGKKYKNATIMFMSTYIVCMWKIRQSNTRMLVSTISKVNYYRNNGSSKLMYIGKQDGKFTALQCL